jgi:CRISPR-associated protein Cmr5
MPEQSLSQQRAKHALAAIRDLENKEYGHYVSYVNGLPAAILQNGLGQALATLLAGAKLAKKLNQRSEDEQARESLYHQISTWLCDSNEDAPYSNRNDVLEAITLQDEDGYLRAQAEALAYLEWLKKFANAFLKRPEGGNYD